MIISLIVLVALLQDVPVSTPDQLRKYIKKALLAIGRDCHFADTPSPFSRCFNSDGERMSAK